MKISVNADLCKRCGACVAACPEAVFSQTAPGQPATVAREDLCISCGHCIALCPSGAIAHSDFPAGSVPPLNLEMMPSASQVLELMRARRSARVFLERPVPAELVEGLIEAAHLAPSAHNMQTTEFLVIHDKQLLQEVTRRTISFFDKTRKQLRNPVIRFLFGLVEKHALEGALPVLPDFDMVVAAHAEGKDFILRGAPCLLLLHANPGTSYPDKNAQLALGNATLMAQALGLGAFYTGYVVGACERDKGLRAMLGIPEGHCVYAGLALGYTKYKFDRAIRRAPARIAWR